MMASMMALPRYDHLQALYHMFAYLGKHHNAEMVFDPSIPDFDVDGLFLRKDWQNTPFVDSKEELPKKYPKPRGRGFTIFANDDSDNVGDLITRRSRTGSIVFLNSSPVYWFSKK